MSIFGSEEESFFDTLLLYLYQTIVLVSLAAAGFIFYLFRTRAPLKEARQGETVKHENGQVIDGTSCVSDDEILLRSALLHEGTGQQVDGYPVSLTRAPPPVPPQQPAKPRHDHEEEEEEEEEDGPSVATWKPAIRQMVTTRQGVQEGPVPAQPTFVQHRQDGYHDQQGFHVPVSPPQTTQGGYHDALKVEAKKRIGQAIQKKQVKGWAGGEFDEAITNIRAASQRLQNSDY